MIKLSIITINKNNAKGLQKTCDSIISQVYSDFEWIVIDGKSIDESIEVIKKYVDKITYWVSEPDSGIYNAMNKGILKAEGEYCLFLNSGDCLSHDRVLEESILNGLDADVVCGNAIFKQSEYHKERYIISPEYIIASKLILEYLPHQSAFIKRKLFFDLHLYDESLKVISDWAFFVETLVIFHRTYKHINLFVSTCDSNGISDSPENSKLMEEEFHVTLYKILPAFYMDYIELKEFRHEKDNPRNILMKKFSNTIWFNIIYSFRRRLLKYGFYEIKASIKRWKYNKNIEKSDNKRKKEIKNKIYELPENLLYSNYTKDDIIASLTSYGNRVIDSVPYALYSLFTQTNLPNRIILFLDDVHWNNENIPPILKQLQKSGLEIMYGKDLLSYKKLIPALKLFPDNIILTFDDDFYYDSRIVEKLLDEFNKSDKKSIICHWANLIERCNGKFLSYSQWKDNKYGSKYSSYAPFGGDGTLYPPHLFDEEIFNENVFMKLSPYADDIWFWLMGYRNGVKVILMDNAHEYKNISVNHIDLIDEKNSTALYFQNCLHGRNDSQFWDLLRHYNME